MSFGTLFMPSTEITSSEQNVYSSMNNAGTLGHHAHLSNQSGTSKLTFTTYNYKLKDSNYTGYSIYFGSLEDPNKAYYIPFIPFISFINKGIPFVLILFLVLIGFGLNEIQKWLHNASSKQKL